MRETKRVKIGSHTYTITAFGAREGLELAVIAQRAVSPAVAELLSAVFGGHETPNTNLAQVAKAIDFRKMAEAISRSLDTKDVARIVDALAKHTVLHMSLTADQDLPEPLDRHIDDHFACRYSEMVEWIVEGLRLNYQDFFAGLGLVQKSTSVPKREP